ncbi:4'-phosphopantetheinyl transferase family protein [Chryseobacterium potabilaquae]|uniref:4'-phosphopantetheinyl transferase sfp n=1 Tax=Chryseobacterium potabilaquae TaxID=2675057 RepID=A0A6N4X6M8_9FLAO|nr:4'-phosphopantetheinyl transferase superfamily protein [Chryseobacterium potabilaquae]CAA7196609.1 4'-phosphopantetheinyl transferase sfp [Chryseobacterium potabilaquae]
MLYLDDLIENWSNSEIERHLKGVSVERQEKIRSYMMPLDRELSLKSYQLLQKGLKCQYGISEPPIFKYNQYKKPSLAQYPNIHFNLSHCKNAVACYIAEHPVGIDVEKIDSFDSDLAQYVLNPKEYEQVEMSENPAVEFTLLWTMKESLVKLIGEGIDNQSLPNILHNRSLYHFESIINKEKGYVVTSCIVK